MKKIMPSAVVLSLFVILGLFFTQFLSTQKLAHEPNITVDEEMKAKIGADYGKLPLHFEPNVGQSADNVDFISRGKGYTLFLTDGEAVLALSRPSQDNVQSDVVRVHLQGAQASAAVFGVDPLPGKSNYLQGNDASQWHTDVPHYGKVKYEAVYPGIDLVYYGTEQRQLEHDFIVSPGADPGQIRFALEGAESLVLDEDGNLVASTKGGDVVLQAPVTYQDIAGKRVSVESRYALLDDAVGFELASYDTDHTVVIDPILSYSTYLGGSGQDLGYAIAVDGSRNAYVTGQSLSINYPTVSPIDGTLNGPQDVVVSVLNSDGSGLLYSTYLGGSGLDIGQGIAVDGSGNAYVTGYTQSSDYPVQSAFQGTHGGGTNDGFVTVLNSSGSALLYSTYFGGGSSDFGYAIAVDGSGNAYVTGYTQSTTSFPTAGTPYQASNAGGDDSYVASFNSAGSIVYSTFLGGSGNDTGWGIAVDGSGNAYVTGKTASTNFPAPGTPYQASSGGSNDAFVSVLNSTGSALVYSTYLGGTGADQGNGIAVDGSGNAYVIGQTASTDFPVPGTPYQGTSGGGSNDAFVSVLNSAGSALVFSTYLGGSGADLGHGIAVDAAGNVHVAGRTASTDFPMAGTPYDGTHNGGDDVFISVLNSAGSALAYSTYLGGAGNDQGNGLALDGVGNVYVGGVTTSSAYPTQSPYQGTHGGGGSDIFVSKMTSNLGVSIPDTLATYGTQVLVPIRIEDPSTYGVVAAEISVTFDNSVVTLGSPDKTSLTGTLVASGWSVEENVFSGVGGIDTLTIAMSTAADTLSGAGDLIDIVLNVADVRHPASTPLNFVNVLFNDGVPTSGSIDGSLTVIGTSGTIDASPDSINPADVVTVTITDADFDVDVGSADQVTATAVSKVYGDTETVTLTETGVNTGVFTGTLTTLFALAADPSQNGTLGTIAGDSICVSYVDSLDVVGATVTRQDTVEVIGGTDGTVAISYVVQALDGRNGLRDTVRVQVSDADLDTDVGVAEQVSATVTNTISGEIEILTLTETGLNTGVFQVRVPTIAGASGTNNNGEFSLASWDTLSLSYNDALSAQGGLNVVQDIGRVVNLFGDVRVNDNVQAFDAARLLAISVGLISSNTQTTLVGDVDGGGAIQAFDASLVLQYVVRLIDWFPVQKDFVADPKNHPFEKPVPLGNVIALGDLEAQGDGTFLLPVSLNERDGILSGTLTLGVDAGIEVVDVDLANDYGSFMVAHNMTTEGLKVAFAGSQSEWTGSGDVLMVKVRGVEGSPIRLSLDHVVLNGQTLTPSVNIEAMEEVITQAPELITELHQNIPNPFNPQTTVKYAIAEAGQVEMVIYSVTGQRIRTLLSEFQDVGSYQIVWDGKDAIGRDVSSGVYLMRMQATGFSQTKKMLLLR